MVVWEDLEAQTGDLAGFAGRGGGGGERGGGGGGLLEGGLTGFYLD